MELIIDSSEKLTGFRDDKCSVIKITKSIESDKVIMILSLMITVDYKNLQIIDLPAENIKSEDNELLKEYEILLKQKNENLEIIFSANSSLNNSDDSSQESHYVSFRSLGVSSSGSMDEETIVALSSSSPMRYFDNSLEQTPDADDVTLSGESENIESPQNQDGKCIIS